MKIGQYLQPTYSTSSPTAPAERIVNGPCYYLVNKQTKWVFELGRGEFWFKIAFGGNGWSKQLHAVLIDLFQDQFTGDLPGLSLWVDGVLARLTEFVGEVPAENFHVTESDSAFRKHGWPIVAHTYAEYWPEERCPTCLSVTNSSGSNYHTKNCSRPDVQVRQKWGHWDILNENE